jgi:hypothetical protein
MTTPQWGDKNLQDHHEKRLRKDDRCWQEILKIDRSMSLEEYEKGSQEAYATGKGASDPLWGFHLQGG